MPAKKTKNGYKHPSGDVQAATLDLVKAAIISFKDKDGTSLVDIRKFVRARASSRTDMLRVLRDGIKSGALVKAGSNRFKIAHPSLGGSGASSQPSHKQQHQQRKPKHQKQQKEHKQHKQQKKRKNARAKQPARRVSVITQYNVVRNDGVGVSLHDEMSDAVPDSCAVSPPATPRGRHATSHTSQTSHSSSDDGGSGNQRQVSVLSTAPGSVGVTPHRTPQKKRRHRRRRKSSQISPAARAAAAHHSQDAHASAGPGPVAYAPAAQALGGVVAPLAPLSQVSGSAFGRATAGGGAASPALSTLSVRTGLSAALEFRNLTLASPVALDGRASAVSCSAGGFSRATTPGAASTTRELEGCVRSLANLLDDCDL